MELVNSEFKYILVVGNIHHCIQRSIPGVGLTGLCEIQRITKIALDMR